MAFHARHPGLRVEPVISERFIDLSTGEPTLQSDLANQWMKPSLAGRSLMRPGLCMPAKAMWNDMVGRTMWEDLNHHLVIGCDGAIANYPAARWLRSVAPHATNAARSEHWQGVVLAVKAGAGLAAMPHSQGENSDLVRVIDNIGLVMPYYLLCTATCRKIPACGRSPISCPRRSSRFARSCLATISLAAECADCGNEAEPHLA